MRRSLRDPTELTYYVVFAPAGMPFATLVRVAGTRWRIEESLEIAKGKVGLDQLEVRKWDGWYRFITLALLTPAYVAVVRHHATDERGGASSLWPAGPQQAEAMLPLTLPEVRRLIQGWVWHLGPPKEELLACSRWQRQHQAMARRCHYKRRGALAQEVQL